MPNQLIHEVSPILPVLPHRAALTNMSNVKRFVARARLEDGRMPVTDEGIVMWRGVAESLALSPDQASKTQQLWHSFRSKLDELFAKRQACYQGEAFAGWAPASLIAPSIDGILAWWAGHAPL